MKRKSIVVVGLLFAVIIALYLSFHKGPIIQIGNFAFPDKYFDTAREAYEYWPMSDAVRGQTDIVDDIATVKIDDAYSIYIAFAKTGSDNTIAFCLMENEKGGSGYSFLGKITEISYDEALNMQGFDSFKADGETIYYHMSKSVLLSSDNTYQTSTFSYELNGELVESVLTYYVTQE